MQRTFVRAAASFLALASLLVPLAALAVTSVSISIAPRSTEYALTAVGPVDDSGTACDWVTVVVYSGNFVTDIDSVCVDVGSGTGGSSVDPGSFGVAAGPPYTLFAYDTGDGDVCRTNENSQACLDFALTQRLVGQAQQQEVAIPAGSPASLALTMLALAALAVATLRRRTPR